MKAVKLRSQSYTKKVIEPNVIPINFTKLRRNRKALPEILLEARDESELGQAMPSVSRFDRRSSISLIDFFIKISPAL